MRQENDGKFKSIVFLPLNVLFPFMKFNLLTDKKKSSVYTQIFISSLLC